MKYSKKLPNKILIGLVLGSLSIVLVLPIMRFFKLSWGDIAKIIGAFILFFSGIACMVAITWPPKKVLVQEGNQKLQPDGSVQDQEKEEEVYKQQSHQSEFSSSNAQPREQDPELSTMADDEQLDHRLFHRISVLREDNKPGNATASSRPLSDHIQQGSSVKTEEMPSSDRQSSNGAASIGGLSSITSSSLVLQPTQEMEFEKRELLERIEICNVNIQERENCFYAELNKRRSIIDNLLNRDSEDPILKEHLQELHRFQEYYCQCYGNYCRSFVEQIEENTNYCLGREGEFNGDALFRKFEDQTDINSVKNYEIDNAILNIGNAVTKLVGQITTLEIQGAIASTQDIVVELMEYMNCITFSKNSLLGGLEVQTANIYALRDHVLGERAMLANPHQQSDIRTNTIKTSLRQSESRKPSSEEVDKQQAGSSNNLDKRLEQYETQSLEHSSSNVVTEESESIVYTIDELNNRLDEILRSKKLLLAEIESNQDKVQRCVNSILGELEKGEDADNRLYIELQEYEGVSLIVSDMQDCKRRYKKSCEEYIAFVLEFLRCEIPQYLDSSIEGEGNAFKEKCDANRKEAISLYDGVDRNRKALGKVNHRFVEVIICFSFNDVQCFDKIYEECKLNYSNSYKELSVLKELYIKQCSSALNVWSYVKEEIRIQSLLQKLLDSAAENEEVALKEQQSPQDSVDTQEVRQLDSTTKTEKVVAGPSTEGNIPMAKEASQESKGHEKSSSNVTIVGEALLFQVSNQQNKQTDGNVTTDTAGAESTAAIEEPTSEVVASAPNGDNIPITKEIVPKEQQSPQDSSVSQSTDGIATAVSIAVVQEVQQEDSTTKTEKVVAGLSSWR